ncbi:hypothetical protein MUK42_28577 [Musa troglodytarum]|uniref:Uncharacterized protein n=1 Tax=Musa troglodytarum TaxID=320322 RepID=A0A9E7JQJ8_9LILI|nr:hypothetical protein MUK42_28577 [Musa troglodytarum]
MKTFDPWPVFFKREFNRNWPFLVGFAITGCIIVKMTAGLTGKLLVVDASLLSVMKLAFILLVFFLWKLAWYVDYAT